jgi:hypothetical protein
MPALMPPLPVLTPNDAADALQANGLDALGLVVPTLSSGWSTVAPGAGDYNAAALRLTLNNPRAPFRGPLHYEATPTRWSDVQGQPVGGPVAVLALHPEAARRLSRLVEWRYGTPLIRPVPVAMVVHGVTLPPAAQAIDWFQAGAPLGLAGSFAVSFHDVRGLPIDPVAVAAIFADLIGQLPALRLGDPAMPAVGAAGGLNGIVALATAAIRCHVVDPHGRAYVPPRETVGRLKVIDAGSAEVAPVPDGGLVNLSAGQRLGRSAADDSADASANRGTPLQWGWAVNGTLGRGALVPPAPPALATQFFRVVAVDLDWHLLGNRTDAQVQGIPAHDSVHPFALPQVRQAVPNFDYLIDGMDVLGAAGQIATGFPPAGVDVLALLTSPVLDPSLAVPPAPGAAGHWPMFPGPNTGTGLPNTADATQGLTAAWRAPGDATDAKLDVIVTVAADAVPPGTHLRVFPRRFVEIAAIGDEPSFVRGDGGAGIAAAGQPTVVLLVNPFGLAPAVAPPFPQTLTVDVVATARTGQRRLHSAVDVPVNAAAQSWTGSNAVFGGAALVATPPLSPLMAAFGSTAEAPASLFGMPASPSSNAPITGIVDLLRRLAKETSNPRQGPRLPTQARFDTVFALGAAPVAGQPLAWRAVLGGARWSWESRSAQPELGDPGNPAGPDVHAAGVRADGQLAYDLALHALKRAQSIAPVSGSNLGWLVTIAGDNWTDPAVDGAGTVSAALLETVAPFTDSPELGVSVLPVPQPTDTIQTLADAVVHLFDPSTDAPTITVANEDRLRRALQREMITAKYGQRDALWALVRAIRQAREFVYVEGPAFAQTARPGGTPLPHEIDLVEELRAGLQNNPRLKVMICVPRIPDFDPAKTNWMRTALAHRRTAIQTLTTQDRNRVAAFHPIGFPGRPTAIRSTVVIVDDVWALVGTSHFRRRGMTFDGGADVVSIDRAFGPRGTSAGIAQFRQETMASKLGIGIPAGPAGASALWTRLADPEAAFGVLAELLASGGLGRCSPVWAGPADTPPGSLQSDDVADPDGVDPDGSRLLSLFGTLLLES